MLRAQEFRTNPKSPASHKSLAKMSNMKTKHSGEQWISSQLSSASPMSCSLGSAHDGSL